MADLTATTVALSPTVYYRLNEASGTVATDTQAHSNGTYVTTYTLNATPNTANDAGSPTFTGGHVSTNLLTTDAVLTGANQSISVFVKFASTSGSRRIAASSLGGPSQGGFDLVYSGGNVGFNISDLSNGAGGKLPARAVQVVIKPMSCPRQGQ